MTLKNRLLFAMVFVFFLTKYAHTAVPPKRVEDTLDRQVSAWNSGDLARFAETYSEDAVFVGTPLLHGRAALLARYKSRYPNKSAMGKLRFHILEVRPLDKKFATVIGEWRLSRSKSAGGDVGGIFSLILRNEDDGWKIVLDHSQQQ